MSILRSPRKTISEELQSEDFQGNTIRLGNQTPRRIRRINFGILYVECLRDRMIPNARQPKIRYIL